MARTLTFRMFLSSSSWPWTFKSSLARFSAAITATRSSPTTLPLSRISRILLFRSSAEAISEGDNIAEAYCNLGIVELGKGDATRALDSFTLALKHEPRHLEGHYNLGSLYYDKGDLRLALLHYEAAVLIEPAFSRAHYNLALVYHKLNDWDKALAALQKYLELEPDDPEMIEFQELLKLLDVSSRGKL